MNCRSTYRASCWRTLLEVKTSYIVVELKKQKKGIWNTQGARISITWLGGNGFNHPSFVLQIWLSRPFPRETRFEDVFITRRPHTSLQQNEFQPFGIDEESKFAAVSFSRFVPFFPFGLSDPFPLRRYRVSVQRSPIPRKGWYINFGVPCLSLAYSELSPLLAL